MTSPDPADAVGRSHDPDHDAPCAQRSCDVVGAFLVDARGWVLLQERDEHAPVHPDQWGLVGGHVEPGERFGDAMVRELAEETGLRPPDDSWHVWYDGHLTPETKAAPELANHWQIWVGRTDATDDDVVLGEGRQIVFVDPARLDELDLASTTALFLPRFLASEDYRRLTAG